MLQYVIICKVIQYLCIVYKHSPDLDTRDNFSLVVLSRAISLVLTDPDLCQTDASPLSSLLPQLWNILYARDSVALISRTITLFANEPLAAEDLVTKPIHLLLTLGQQIWNCPVILALVLRAYFFHILVRSESWYQANHEKSLVDAMLEMQAAASVVLVLDKGKGVAGIVHQVLIARPGLIGLVCWYGVEDIAELVKTVPAMRV